MLAQVETSEDLPCLQLQSSALCVAQQHCLYWVLSFSSFAVKIGKQEVVTTSQAKNVRGEHVCKKNILIRFITKGLFNYCIVDKLQHGILPKALNDHAQNEDSVNLDLFMIPFVIIENSTSHFSDKCKLGEGGFGVVYKVLIIVSKFILI